jgi:hypothetical protein
MRRTRISARNCGFTGWRIGSAWCVCVCLSPLLVLRSVKCWREPKIHADLKPLPLVSYHPKICTTCITSINQPQLGHTRRFRGMCQALCHWASHLSSTGMDGGSRMGSRGVIGSRRASFSLITDMTGVGLCAGCGLRPLSSASAAKRSALSLRHSAEPSLKNIEQSLVKTCLCSSTLTRAMHEVGVCLC